ncbi:MAG: tRNA (adenosine(37)-N6)-threonylcarbamoyltransferase complex dimerization subunit type 1 TsaB [Thermoanaerobaculia bacterium]|nr:tRNA (adenosine(37)-N6)-threonylcarbamoyltransferase complex dimerization subunit type 1 TsaB [Thermoanaerobaculia bacterium]
MRILSLDTASPFPSLAAGDGDRAETTRALPQNAAESLPLAAKALLAEMRLTVRDLDRVAVVSGPGSFTGLRAGLAFARGLARARGIPLVLVSTFAAAHEAVPEPGNVLFILGAGRGDVHAALRTGRAVAAAAPPRPRTEVEAEARARGLSVLDLGLLGLPLAAAAGRVAARDETTTGAVVYGRPSAAEEKQATLLASGPGRTP